MSLIEWSNINIEQLESFELCEVDEFEKGRVKQYVLSKHSSKKRMSIWKTSIVAAVVVFVITTATAFTFPSFAAQIPYVHNVMSYFGEAFSRFNTFEQYSDHIGLEQSSHGITMKIDQAVYDGRNITVSYIVETESDFDESFQHSTMDFFSVAGATMYSASSKFTKLTDTQFIGYINYIPEFPDKKYPETVEITMNPSYFYSSSNSVLIKGDWLFKFSLKKIESKTVLVNQTTTHPEVYVTIKSLQFTGVSTMMSYEELVTDELLSRFGFVGQLFHISDDLGYVYMDGLEAWGGGFTSNNYDLLKKGTVSFGVINENASQLIIKPTIVENPFFKRNRIELEPIIIDLTQYR